jgi:hypothetical protein
MVSTGCATVKTHLDSAPPPGLECGFLHPIEAPPPQVIERCAVAPPRTREHVYVYLVNGFDPLYVGNLKGLRDYVKQLGFTHAYCGEMTQMPLLRSEIRKVYRVDPAARFVLAGYSAGANAVRDLAHDLKSDGISVDLLVYIGGDTIRNVPASKPDNVRTLLNINGHGLVLLGYDVCFKGSDIDGAVNHRLDARHMLLPSRPQTAELLAQHLAEVTARGSARY